jgi:hypothetical protein
VQVYYHVTLLVDLVHAYHMCWADSVISVKLATGILTVEQVSHECSLGSMYVYRVCVIHHI